MRSTRSVRSFLVAALAVLAVGCSSEAATSGNSSNGGGDVSNGETAGSVAADPGTPAVESTSAPAPVTDGAWPPADACTLLDQATAEALTGETLAFAPVPLSGEFAYGPYCEYTSDASGLFMVVSTYSPADLATYTDGWVAEGRATALSGVGDSALLEVIPGINDSRVYVTSGGRAFSVQINSFTDNGWTPEIATSIATAVATALVG
jgi:hypothetical protein